MYFYFEYFDSKPASLIDNNVVIALVTVSIFVGEFVVNVCLVIFLLTWNIKDVFIYRITGFILIMKRKGKQWW
jgi:hypothetical protein